MARLKTLVRNEAGVPPLRGGHALCQGCGVPMVVRTIVDSIETPTVVVSATGCLEATMPQSPRLIIYLFLDCRLIIREREFRSNERRDSRQRYKCAWTRRNLSLSGVAESDRRLDRVVRCDIGDDGCIRLFDTR